MKVNTHAVLENYVNTNGYNARSTVELLVNTDKGLFKVVTEVRAGVDDHEAYVLRWSDAGFRPVVAFRLADLTQATYRSEDKQAELSNAAWTALERVQALNFTA
ncbi:MAG: hypothetical protein EBS91_00220 [Betaproteobacteria bacterium]|nr:hypothetical protein [Betaproteobacteria bacterium]NCA23060.1 hypothetical protein [Betaproteobacteria bacterium]